MSKKDDVTLALGVLNTIASGLASAHQADVSMRIATLQSDLDKKRIESDEARANLMFARDSEQAAKNEYFTSLKELDKFNIPAQEITTAGTNIIQRTFDGKKANLDAIMDNVDTYETRLQNVVNLKSDIQQQLTDYTEYEAGFAGLSGILNPGEYDKFREFAMAVDDPETDEIEGLDYGTKYPEIGTAGIDCQYKQLGTRSSIRVSEENALKTMLAEERQSFDKDYAVLKSVFTVEHGEDDNDKKKVQNTEKAAEKMGLDYQSFTTLQGLFSTTSGEDALSQLYSMPGAADAVNVLRQNSATSFVMENLEKRYDKILDINAERVGKLGTTPTDYSTNLIDQVMNADNLDDALHVYTTATNMGVNYDTANEIMTTISSRFDTPISELETKWNNRYRNDDGTSKFTDTIDKKDDVLGIFSQDVKGNKNSEEVVSVVRDNKEVDKIDAGAIFDLLDQFKVPGTNKFEIEDYFQNLLDKDSRMYDPDKARIFANALNSRTLMPFDDTPATHYLYDKTINSTADAFTEAAGGLFGLGSGNLFDVPTFSPGTVPGEIPLNAGIFNTQSIYLKDETGELVLDESGQKISAAQYWKGDDQQGWSLGNALGMSKFNFAGESSYMDAYNNSMEESYDKLIDTVDAPGLDMLYKSGFFMNEQMAGAYIKANFGQDAYDKAHADAQEAGRTAQIGQIKEILNDPGSTDYVALMDMLNEITEYNQSTNTYDDTLSYPDSENEKLLENLYYDTNLIPGGSTQGVNTGRSAESFYFEREDTINPRINPNFKTENVRSDFNILIDMWNDLTDEQRSEFGDDFETYYNFNMKDYGGLSMEELI